MNKQEIEKAIDDLDDLKNCESISSSHFKEVHGKNLELAISALEKQLSNGWIPVSDRLPEPRSKSFGDKQQRVDVLACQRNGMVKEMLFEFSTQEFWEAGDTNPISHWQEDDNGYGAEVIAWQPLPEPYRPKEDSE